MAKKIITLLIAVFTMMSCNKASARGATSQDSASTQSGKNLIVYFSHRGMTYMPGGFIDLKVGHTERMAQKIQASVGGDLLRIEPEKPYPHDYRECCDVAKVEHDTDQRPAITTKVPANIADYDTVYVGYPIWWGTFPMPVFTFLEQCDLSGKTVVPFSTNEGSGWGSSLGDIAKCCPKSTIAEGLELRGHAVDNSDRAIAAWLKRITAKR